jgi:hypothetical protein
MAMGRAFLFEVVLLVALVALTACGAAPTSTAPILDDFKEGTESPVINCYSHQNEQAIKRLGYCVYFENADVNLSYLPQNSGLRIKWVLPILRSGGNWFSMRRQDGEILDLGSYSGLKAHLRVDVPAGAILRITMADVIGEEMRNDELWWCDNKDILSEKSDQWQTVTCPFTDFYLASGVGTRQNDQKMDLTRIVAYEINIVSETPTLLEGDIVVNLLEAYR